MNEFKESLNQAFRKLVMMEDKWEKLDSHERQTVEQVAQETGFDELGNFEEVVDTFKQFYLQMQRTTVINGYQVWIDDSRRLHIIINNAEWILSDLVELKTASQTDYPSRVDKPSLIKIISWYIDNV